MRVIAGRLLVFDYAFFSGELGALGKLTWISYRLSRSV